MDTTTELQERLTRLGRHLDTERAARTAATTTFGSEHPSTVDHDLSTEPAAGGASGSGLARVAATVALVAAVAAGVVALSQRLPAQSVDTAVYGGEPAGVPEGAPVPGATAPIVESPPDWFGEPRAGRRPAADRIGHWVSTAIGQDDGSGIVLSPIWIGATTGSLRDMNTADTIVVGTETFRVLDFGTGWRALATTGEPSVVAAGVVDTALLVEVLNATHVEFTGSEITALSLDQLPEQYIQLLRPQEHAPDVADRRTLTNATGDIALNETSDWVEPKLAAAASGATFEAISVGDTIGWTGHTDLNPYGPVTFLMWSPEPGVVLEIGSTNADRSIEDLVELALTVDLLPSEIWDAEVPPAGN